MLWFIAKNGRAASNEPQEQMRFVFLNGVIKSVAAVSRKIDPLKSGLGCFGSRARVNLA